MTIDQNLKGSMRAAYFFQAVNLSVSILIVPMLLRYLNISGYVKWSVFTVFGAVTLQLQNGIQPVAVREIARAFSRGDSGGMHIAIRRARRAYAMLVLFVIGPLLAAGFFYLRVVMGSKIGTTSISEWLVYIGAWALNYSFATNSAILLGTVRVAKQNNINSLTRMLYLLISVVLLRQGLSVMGLCVGFAATVVVSCLLTTRAAQRRLKEFALSLTKADSAVETSLRPRDSIWKNVFYSLAAYSLYSGALLVAATIFPKEDVARYGLSLQIFALMSGLAAVPVQVWLNRLVGAVRRRDHALMTHELAATLTAANFVFCLGFTLLVGLGDSFLHALGSSVLLPRTPDLLSLFVAYLIELNIAVFANFLITVEKYRFVRVYLCTSLASLVLAAITATLTRRLSLSLVVVPAAVQSIVCLPMIFRLVCREVGESPRQFLTSTYAYVRSLVSARRTEL